MHYFFHNNLAVRNFYVTLRPIFRTIKVFNKILKRLVCIFFIALLIDACLIWACCKLFGIGISIGDSNMADASQTILTDSVAKADYKSSEIALQVESGIVLEHVRNIFDIVKHESVNLGGSVDNDLLDKTYCSKSWNDLLAAVRRKEFRTNNLFFEVNHWTMTYETNLVRFDEFEVKCCYIDADNERLASVQFTVYTPDNYIPARVDLVYEDGEWKIDNFHHLKYAMNMKECMWEYLHNDHSEFI